MDIHDVRKALRSSWWLVLLITATCTVAAAAYTQRIEPRYESTVQIFVAAQERERGVQGAPSYAGLVTSPNVTAPVARALSLPDSPAEFAKRLSASAPPDTVLIDITVEDSEPVRAQRTARAVANRLIELVERLERPVRQRSSPPVRLFVSSAASLPADPVSPDARLNIGAGVVLGSILGVLAAVLRRRLDRRISTPEDLPEGSGLSVLTTVPRERAGGPTALDGLRSASPERAEALRRLRTNLRALTPGQPHRTVVVASALPGEGASTTAVGLALAMAEAGSDVVLLEADLRRPWLADQLGLRGSEGLAGHLITGAPVAPLLQPWSHAGARLRVLVAGAPPPNPSELLSSPRMRELLEDLRSSCDLVLIDAPPVLSVTDAAVLAGEADGVLLVVRMRHITRPELERALSTLAHARGRLLGFVANGVATTGAGDRRRAYPPRPGAAAVQAPRAPEARPEPGTRGEARGPATPTAPPKPEPAPGPGRRDPSPAPRGRRESPPGPVRPPEPARPEPPARRSRAVPPRKPAKPGRAAPPSDPR